MGHKNIIEEIMANNDENSPYNQGHQQTRSHIKREALQCMHTIVKPVQIQR